MFQANLTIETAEFSTSNPEYSTDSFPGNFTSAGGGNFFFTAYSTQSVEAVVNGFADTIQLGGIELRFSNGTESGTGAAAVWRALDAAGGEAMGAGERCGSGASVA